MDETNEIQMQVLRYLLARLQLTASPPVDYAYLQREWSLARLRAALMDLRDRTAAQGWHPAGGTVTDVARVDLSDEAIAAGVAVAVVEERERRALLQDREALAGIAPAMREEPIRLIALRTRLPIEEVRHWPPEEFRPYLAELNTIRDWHASDLACQSPWRLPCTHPRAPVPVPHERADAGPRNPRNCSLARYPGCRPRRSRVPPADAGSRDTEPSKPTCRREPFC